MSITQDIYDKKMQELQQRQYEISNKIEGQVEDDKVFQTQKPPLKVEV